MSHIKTKKGKRACAAKKTYYEKATADYVAALRRREGTYWRVYKCAGAKGQPGHWHLTTSPKRL